MKQFVVLLIFGFSLGLSYGQEYQVISPQGDLELQISVKEEIAYSVLKKGQVVMQDNKAALQLEDKTLGQNPKIKAINITM